MIKNEAFLLRAVEPGDLELLYDWENRMELWSVSNTLTPFSKAQLARYVKNAALDVFQTKQLRLMIDAYNLQEMPLTVGMIDLFDYDPYHNRAGVGIMVNSEWRGRGVAASALKLFMGYAFNTLGLHQLYCHITESNAASIKLFESAGFRLIGVKQEWLRTSAGYQDELMFQCLKVDFR